MAHAAVKLVAVQPMERPPVSGRRLLWYPQVLLLAFTAPVIAELLTGLAPPREFFSPATLGLSILIIGGSAVLVREAALRWKCGWWGILILGAGFGLLQESIAALGMLDPVWPALGSPARPGVWLSVNWIWMLDATLYRAVFSTALPILLVHQISPKQRALPWLNTGSFWSIGSLFAVGAGALMIFGKNKYPVRGEYLLAFAAAILFLVGVTRKASPSSAELRRRGTTGKLQFAALSFLATLALVWQIYVLPQLVHEVWIIAAALTSLALVTAWLLSVRSGGHLTSAQSNALLVGCLGCFAILSFYQEFNPASAGSARGMSLVGIGALAGLFGLWRMAPVETDLQLDMPIGLVERADAGSHIGDVPILWRLFEIVVALVALVLTAPIILVLAILIRRGTPGRAFFHQSRVGMDGKPFTFVKFRTLYADARQRFPHLYAYQYSEQVLQEHKFKVVNDPRVTPQGRWMRTTTLDELPNFWNVLCGDMALVGPRPEIPEMLPYYKGNMLRKFSVRPGVTGLAQISGRGRLSFYETVGLDVEYVLNRSVLLDLKIIALTVYKIVTRDGAF